MTLKSETTTKFGRVATPFVVQIHSVCWEGAGAEAAHAREAQLYVHTATPYHQPVLTSL